MLREGIALLIFLVAFLPCRLGRQSLQYYFSGVKCKVAFIFCRYSIWIIYIYITFNTSNKIQISPQQASELLTVFSLSFVAAGALFGVFFADAVVKN
jgi:hypothetical protein